MAAAAAITVALFALVAFVFIPLGQFVGWYLENTDRGTRGYSVNILGSLAGIGLFTLLSFLDQPPACWLVAAGVMLVALVWRIRWRAGRAPYRSDCARRLPRFPQAVAAPPIGHPTRN